MFACIVMFVLKKVFYEKSLKFQYKKFIIQNIVAFVKNVNTCVLVRNFFIKNIFCRYILSKNKLYNLSFNIPGFFLKIVRLKA